MYLTPENGQYWPKLAACVEGTKKIFVFDGISLSVFNVMYNNGMNSTKTVLKVYCLYYLQIPALTLLVYLLTLRQRHGIYKGRVTSRQ